MNNKPAQSEYESYKKQIQLSNYLNASNPIAGMPTHDSSTELFPLHPSSLLQEDAFNNEPLENKREMQNGDQGYSNLFNFNQSYYGSRTTQVQVSNYSITRNFSSGTLTQDSSTLFVGWCPCDYFTIFQKTPNDDSFKDWQHERSKGVQNRLVKDPNSTPSNNLIPSNFKQCLKVSKQQRPDSSIDIFSLIKYSQDLIREDPNLYRPTIFGLSLRENVERETDQERKEFNKKNHLFSYMKFVVSNVLNYFQDKKYYLDTETTLHLKLQHRHLIIAVDFLRLVFQEAYKKKTPQFICYLEKLKTLFFCKDDTDKTVKGIADALAQDIHFGSSVCFWIKELLLDESHCIFLHWVLSSRVKNKNGLLIHKNELMNQTIEIENYLALCEITQKAMDEDHANYSEKNEVFGGKLKAYTIKNSRITSLFVEKNDFFSKIVNDNGKENSQMFIEAINSYKRSLKRTKL